MNLDELADRLGAANSDGRQVDNADFRALSRDEAYEVQDRVGVRLGRTVGMLKTAVHPGGVGVASPIPSSGVGRAPSFRFPLAAVAGIEVEVGVVLGRDVGSSADLPDAIARYFTGVEICGTRYTDRLSAGPTGGLADSQSALGYVIGADRAAEDRIVGLDVVIELDGKRIYDARAKHGFGDVLASLRAYADAQRPSLPLRAGTIITTGSMCGLVPVPGPGHVVARLGDQAVEFDLV